MSRLVWIYGVGMLAFASLTSVLALFLGARFGVNAKTIGPFFLYVGGLSVVMRTVFLGPIVDRIGETWAMRSRERLLLIVGLLLYPAGLVDPAILALIMPLVPIGTALLFPVHHGPDDAGRRPGGDRHGDGRGADLRRRVPRGGAAHGDGGVRG